MAKKELDLEELEKVSGGITLPDTAGIHLADPVDKYEVHKYSHLYFARNKAVAYTLYARVIAQREQKRIFSTITVFDVEVIDKTSCVGESGYTTLYSDTWKAYKTCNYK